MSTELLLAIAIPAAIWAAIVWMVASAFARVRAYEVGEPIEGAPEPEEF